MRFGRVTLAGVGVFQDRVSLDMGDLGPGVFAVSAPNGYGKTTFLEAISAGALYQELPSRKPKADLANYVGDAGLALEVEFAIGLDKYRSTVEIAKAGTKAILTKNGAPVTGGGVREYQAAIAALIGPSNAYYASAFGLQNGEGKIATLTRNERKAVFRHYLQLEEYERLHGKTTILLKTIGAVEPAIDKANVDLNDEQAKQKSALGSMTRAKVLAGEAATKRSNAEKALGEAIKLSSELEAWRTAMQQYEDREKAVERAMDEAARCYDRLKATESAPEPERVESVDVEELRVRAKRWRELERQASKIDREFESQTARLGELVRDHSAALARSGTVGSVPCAGEGKYAKCAFLTEAVAAKAAVAKIQIDIDTLKDRVEKVAADLREIQQLQADVGGAAIETELEIAESHNAIAQRVAAEASRRAERIAKCSGAYESAKKAAIDAQTEHKKTKRPLPWVGRSTATETELRSEVDRLRDEEHKWIGEVAKFDGEIEASKARCAELRKLKTDLFAKLSTQQAAELLHSAVGPNGVQAFEIDSAGPTITSFANDLLQACYGPRFTVEIATTRELKSRDGLAEDLAIRVWDAKRDTNVDISMLSGGEQVVVDEAIRTSLAVFAAGRLATPIETIFRDETAGALDADNACRYVDMLRRARELGKLHQIFFVTHNKDLVSSADGVVEIAENGKINFL